MKGLTAEDLEMAQDMIDNLPSGQYTLPTIYGELWDAIPNKTKHGRHFKRSVLDGNLAKITWSGRDTENHQIYTVV